MENDVEIRDKQEGQLLFTCSIQEVEKAYQYAKQMEELGIEIEFHGPSLPETLARELGANAESISTLKGEIDDEILSHQGSCCGPSQEQKEKDE